MPGLTTMPVLAEKSAATTLVCAATSWEARPLGQALHLAPSETLLRSGAFGGRDIYLLRTGIGAESLFKTLETLPPEIHFTSIISSGFCGALLPELNSGDIVCDLDPADPGADQRARAIAENQGRRIHRGRIAHSQKIVSSADSKKELAALSNAAAVDMETTPLRSWARSRRPTTAVHAVRAVLDELGDRLPENLPGGEGLASDLLSALKRPRDWPDLARIYFNQKKAAAALSEFMAEFLKRP